MLTSIPAAFYRDYDCFLKGEDIADGWNHTSLLKAAVVAAVRFPESHLEQLRQGILALNERHLNLGTGNYHHTLTCVWGQLVKQWLSQADLNDPNVWNRLQVQLSDSRIPLMFYSHEKLDSERARSEWVPPDIAPISLPSPLPDELRTVWWDFCRLQISAERWTHQAHLEVAQAALIGYRRQARFVLKSGILRLNASHGIIESPDRGYHETLTHAWVRLVCEHLTESGYWTSGQLMPLPERLLRKDTLFDFYSRERLKLHQARYQVIEPDLRPLPDFPEHFFSFAAEGIEKNSRNLAP